MRLPEKVHGPQQHFEIFRPQMTGEALPGIPFSQKTELILIFHALVKIAALAALLRAYRTHQRRNSLREFHPLARAHHHPNRHAEHGTTLGNLLARSYSEGRSRKTLLITNRWRMASAGRKSARSPFCSQHVVKSQYAERRAAKKGGSFTLESLFQGGVCRVSPSGPSGCSG
jgi:hypothetical protein